MQDFERDQIEKDENADSGIPLRAFFEACLGYWYWFVISIVGMTLIAFVFTQSQTQTFLSNATVVINIEDKNGGGSIASELSMFSDLGFNTGADNVENEMYVMKSTTLLDEVVKELGIDVMYYNSPVLRKVNLYKNNPIALTPLGEVGKKGYKLEIIPQNGDEFEYRCTTSEVDDDWHNAKFGNKVVCDADTFVITATHLFDAEEMSGEKLYVDVSNVHERSLALSKNLVVQMPEDVRGKFRGTLTRIVNEGATGLICLIL